MTRQWRAVSPEEAQKHPLYGVKNWLVVFAFSVLIGGLLDLGALNSEAHSAGMTIYQLLALGHPAITFAKVALTLNAATVIIIYWLLFTKHRKFRPVASLFLIGGWPVIALFGVTNSFPGLANALALSFLPWAISSAVWVTYLQRSKRVRVTFEHCIPSVVPVNAPPTHAQASSSVAPVTDSEDELWALALAEFESDARRLGLWARVFAAAQGNENSAKAQYLQERVHQMEATRFMYVLLRALVAKKGSDLFITANFPPAMKIDGKMTSVSNTALTSQHTAILCRAVMNDKQAAEFEVKKECNFAIAPADIGRFQVNCFAQQGQVGMVLSLITTSIPISRT